MNCPNCGAPLEPMPNRPHLRCVHCSTVQLVEPTSEGLIDLDREYGMKCPCCVKPMTAASIDGFTVGHCASCQGILLESGEFAEVVSHHRDRSGGPCRPELIDATEFGRVTRCPKCHCRMDTHVYGAGGNAVIDSCERCQLIWLDAGELKILQRYHAAN